jgi:hypothetical protein
MLFQLQLSKDDDEEEEDHIVVELLGEMQLGERRSAGRLSIISSGDKSFPEEADARTFG